MPRRLDSATQQRQDGFPGLARAHSPRIHDGSQCERRSTQIEEIGRRHAIAERCVYPDIVAGPQMQAEIRVHLRAVSYSSSNEAACIDAVVWDQVTACGSPFEAGGIAGSVREDARRT